MTIAKLLFDTLSLSGPDLHGAARELFNELMKPSDDERVKALQSLMHEGANQFIAQQQRQAG
jgi:hypothetical protein